jgi:phosphate transport system substrate-binding protein
MKVLVIALLGVLLLAGCGREPGSKVLTKGTLQVACDESVYPAVRLVVEEFLRQYPDSKISVRPVEAREATTDFVNDSVRVIVLARPLNREERTALQGSKVWFEEYHVAQGAVAAIAHPANPVRELRLGQLDSMFSGRVTHWGGGVGPIDLVVGGLNSSTNEIFRDMVMEGRGFDRSATPMDSSAGVIDYVAQKRNALGIVGVAWLQGRQDKVTVLSLSRPGMFLDSTETVGRAYSPAQAYVYKGWYPLGTPVYIYTREIERDISVGFISFASSGPGQKMFLEAGLVPVTMPVRLVQLTSEQVK